MTNSSMSLKTIHFASRASNRGLPGIEMVHTSKEAVLLTDNTAFTVAIMIIMAGVVRKKVYWRPEKLSSQ
jgi:hypothetical protein